MDVEVLSKILSHALRHEPWVYELELDDGDWATLRTCSGHSNRNEASRGFCRGRCRTYDRVIIEAASQGRW